MANKKPKQNKPKTGLARCLELASNKKGLVFLSAILSSLAAIGKRQILRLPLNLTPLL